MPFLPQFTTDLFISYSPIDDKSLIPSQRGWVSTFQEALSIRLSQLLGTPPTISNQDELQNNGNQLGTVGLLVSVVSPAYVSSQTCLNQINNFIESANHTGGLSIDDKPRIFKVTKMPVNQEKQPLRLVNLLNYEFYQVEGTGRAHELKPEGNPNITENYWLKLDDLAYDIQQVLEMLKARGDSYVNEAPQSENVVTTARTVFISYASENEVTAQRICDLLEGRGIDCWIASRDALPCAEYAPQITDAIDGAEACVLILSRDSNASVHVINEVEWATSHGKPVFTVRLEDVSPSKRLALHISTRQWLNCWAPPLDEKIHRLGTAIKQEIGLHGSNESIYLAETSFDLRDERDIIRRELQQRGYPVLPDRSLPSDAATFKKVVRDYLSRSRLSIHLVGDNYGDTPKGETKSLVVLQNELAQEQSLKPGFSHLIWIPPGVKGQDVKQREFIESLNRESGSQQRFDLLHNSLEELKSFIEETLTNRKPRPPAASPGGPLHIYLICDQQDLPSVLPIRDYLYDKGYEAILPAMTGGEAEVREDHKDNLITCDACLIYYGAANEFWVRSKLRDLQKSAGYGRTKPMIERTVYLASPQTPDKINYRTLDATVIRNFDVFDPDLLKPFLAALARTESVKGGRQ